MNSHCHNGTINNEIAAQQAREIHKRIQPFAFVFCSFPFFCKTNSQNSEKFNLAKSIKNDVANLELFLFAIQMQQTKQKPESALKSAGDGVEGTLSMGLRIGVCEVEKRSHLSLVGDFN